jgi:hypothetical protein
MHEKLIHLSASSDICFRIWNYLKELTKSDQVDAATTIIITTHYIEEARQAHFLGFMRNGRIVEENRPEHLMTKYGRTVRFSLLIIALALCLLERLFYNILSVFIYLFIHFSFLFFFVVVLGARGGLLRNMLEAAI